MERRVSDKNILNSFAEGFCKVVERHTPYIIVSGFVAIASGRARGTEDIDMIIPRLSKEDFFKLHEDLLRNGFTCIQSADEKELFLYLKDNLSIRYTLKNKPIPEMEVKFAKDLIDQMQLNTRIKLPLTKLDVWFSSINVNIAFKEEYLKSPKDLEDAKHLRIVYTERINETEINDIKKMLRKRK